MPSRHPRHTRSRTQEGPIALQLRKVWRDDDYAGNHAAWNEGVVGAIVAVGDELRGGPNRGHVGNIRGGMPAQHVVESPQDGVKTKKKKKNQKQKGRFFGEHDGASGPAPG